jgi:hypothetical protein
LENIKEMKKQTTIPRTRQNLRKQWKLGTVALISTILLISCTTSPKNSAVVPDPFQEDGTPIVSYDKEADEVRMPLWYWKKIVRYIVDAKD